MNPKPLALLLGIAGAAALSFATGAELNHTAPAKVSLAGLWRLNPDLSDDPYKAVASKRESAGNRPMGGGGGPVGRGPGTGGGTATGGGTVIDAGEVLGDIFGRASGKTGGAAGKGDRPAGDPEPATMRVPLDSFLATLEQFEIQQQPDALTITTEEEANTCKPAEPGQAPVPGGELGERHCGWKGDTWVIEIKAPDDVMRTNRYELRKGGRQLVVVSEVRGGKDPLSGLKIRRVYERML